MSLVQEYKEQFSRHYPSYDVKVKPRRMKDKSIGYAVYINGDAGSMILSEADLRYAVRMFMRGR